MKEFYGLNNKWIIEDSMQMVNERGVKKNEGHCEWARIVHMKQWPKAILNFEGKRK